MGESERDTMSRLHLEFQDRLPMWVIYNTTTRDHPGRWVVRLHTSLPEPEATTLSMVRDSLKAAREALPYGLTCIGRSPDDDPVIYEVWL